MATRFMIGLLLLKHIFALRLRGRRRATWRRARRQSRQARPQLMPWPSRSRKMRIRRYPKRGYCAPRAAIRASTGASFSAFVDR